MHRDLNIKVFFSWRRDLLLWRIFMYALSIFSWHRMIGCLQLLYEIYEMALSTLFLCFADSKNSICFDLIAFCMNHADFGEPITFFWTITAAFLSIIDTDFFEPTFAFILLCADLTFFSVEQKNSYLWFVHSSSIFLKAPSIFSLWFPYTVPICIPLSNILYFNLFQFGWFH